MSAQFDEPSEPERRQAPRQFSRLAPGWRQSAMEGRKGKLKWQKAKLPPEEKDQSNPPLFAYSVLNSFKGIF